MSDASDDLTDLALMALVAQASNPVKRRVLSDGRIVELWLQMFNWKLTITKPEDDSKFFTGSWLYKHERRLEVAKIADTWDGEGEPPGWNKCEQTQRWREDGTPATEVYQHDDRAVRMVLHCPSCGGQHIDRGEWATPRRLHRTHLCEHCGHTWKPHDVATVGVESVPSPEPTG